MRRSRMRRLRDAVRTRIRPGGWGSPSGPTTWLCLQWLDADRMKAAKASRIGGGNARPVPEERSPGHKSPHMERRKATRFLSQRKRTNTFAPCGASCPSLGRQENDHPRGARGSECACVNGSAHQRGCLTTESGMRCAHVHPNISRGRAPGSSEKLEKPTARAGEKVSLSALSLALRYLAFLV